MRPDISFRGYPLFKVVAFTICGMFFGSYMEKTSIPIWWWIVLSAIVLLLTLLFIRKPILSSCTILFSVFFFGAYIALNSNKSLNINLPKEPILYDAVLLSEPIQHNKVIKVDLAIKTNIGYIKAKASILRDTLYNSYKTLHVGDGIQAFSKFTKPYNYPEAKFDYVKWLKQNNFLAETFIYSSNWEKIAVKLNFLSYLDRCRILIKKIKRKLAAKLLLVSNKQDDIAIASTLMFGDKSFIPKELKEQYSISGASHILAISGLHIGIISGMLLFLFSLFNNKIYTNYIRRYFIDGFVVLTVVWAYAFIVDLSYSVLRSVIMITCYIVFSYMYRKSFSINSLGLSAILILLFNPQALWDMGFQLSFMAVFSISIFMPIFSGLFKTTHIMKNSLLKTIWTFFAVSVSAQIATAPLLVYYFGRISCYFLLSNTIVIPCTTIILYGSCIMFLLYYIPNIQLFICKLLLYIIDLMNISVKFISDLPMSSIENIHISVYQLLLIYVLIFSIWYLLQFYLLLSSKLTHIKFES